MKPWMKPPCVQCPFREGSAYGYDTVTIQTLDFLCNPCCHFDVRSTNVLCRDVPIERQECSGFYLWKLGIVGFNKPRLIPNETPRVGRHDLEDYFTGEPPGLVPIR